MEYLFPEDDGKETEDVVFGVAGDIGRVSLLFLGYQTKSH